MKHFDRVLPGITPATFSNIYKNLIICNSRLSCIIIPKPTIKLGLHEAITANPINNNVMTILPWWLLSNIYCIFGGNSST